MRFLHGPCLLLAGALLLLGPGRPSPAQGQGAQGKIDLFEALKHKDRDVRREAVKAVIKLLAKAKEQGQLEAAAKAIVNPLIDSLQDKDRIVRATAAQALGTIGPDAVVAVPALKEALKDRDFAMRLQAA